MFRARGPREVGTLQQKVAEAAAKLADQTQLPGEEADAEKGEGQLGLLLAHAEVSSNMQSAVQLPQKVRASAENWQATTRRCGIVVGITLSFLGHLSN